MRTQIIFTGASDNTRITQQLYAAWQQALNPQWQLDVQLGWGKWIIRIIREGNGTYLKRWLPKLGLIYTPDAGTHVRLAAWQGIGLTQWATPAAPVSLAASAEPS